MQSSPFRPVIVLSEELLCLSLEGPCLQPWLATVECGLRELPRELAPTVTAHPLAIDINVYIDIKSTFHEYSHVCSW